ncbi:MAG: alpha/beta hydrolase [Bacteroidia bacterium]|nr:alpha/beta hydrolase [Bacteroidia bacterium]
MLVRLRFISLITLLFLFSSRYWAQRHVFYLHGRIVEIQGARAVDSTNGYVAYKYDDIIDSLKKAGFIVHSEVRAKNTNAGEYAGKIKKQVDSLLKKGVNPQDITVVGASKGSYIAMLVSSYCKNSDLNFVFMASCHPDITKEIPDLEFYGNVLSIYEKSDIIGSSCVSVKNKSKHLGHYKELEINTGLRHGFLYKPIPQWLHPCISWAKGNYNF